MRMKRLLLGTLIAVAWSVSAVAQDHVATLAGVAGVEDGDGLLFGQVEVRLQGVAAPELDQPMGPESYEGLSGLADGKEVVCHLDGTTAGRSGRPVGVCYVGGIDVGQAQIEAGLARDCPAYSKGRYRDAESYARTQGRDLSLQYELPSYCGPGGG